LQTDCKPFIHDVVSFLGDLFLEPQDNVVPGIQGKVNVQWWRHTLRTFGPAVIAWWHGRGKTCKRTSGSTVLAKMPHYRIVT